MNFTNALIIGSGGQVAKALATTLGSRNTIFTSSTDRPGAIPCNLASPNEIHTLFQAVKEKWPGQKVEVFLPGALTNVEKCESEKELCKAINWAGPSLVAAECKIAGYGLTFFSTEYVFGGEEVPGGKEGPYSEEDLPSPISWYGQCKLEGERAVRNTLGEQALIVRTTMIFSFDPPNGLNFFMQYLKQFELAKNGLAKPFRIPMDQISTPTYAPQLSANVVSLRDRNIAGTFNIVGKDRLSRRDLVLLTAKEFGYSDVVHQSYEFTQTSNLNQLARRPLNAGLTSAKAELNGLKPLSLLEAFEDVKSLMNYT